MVKSELVSYLNPEQSISYPCLRCKLAKDGTPWIIYLFNVIDNRPVGTVVWYKTSPEYVGCLAAFGIEETEPFNGSVTLS